VIVRARDEAGAIGRCLALLARQHPAPPDMETIVVDSGSRDDTAEIARDHGARVLSLPPASFTFGGALNLGAANAQGEILVALSAHAFIPDTGWLERLTAAVSDPGIACASGDRYGPDGRPLAQAVDQDLELALRNPGWGYSNGAGAFRAELWRRRPFRTDLPGCEDLEWALHWLEQGYRARIDPSLVAEHDHTHDHLPDIFRRARREAEGLALIVAGRDGAAAAASPDAAGGGVLREWWSDTRFYASPLRARLSHRRVTRLLGARAGRRRALRRLSGGT